MARKKARVRYVDDYPIQDSLEEGYLIEHYDETDKKWYFSSFFYLVPYGDSEDKNFVSYQLINQIRMHQNLGYDIKIM